VDENDNISYDAQTSSVGKNAVEIIPISREITPSDGSDPSGDSEADGADDDYDGDFLLIPAMGGPQQGGAANGAASVINRISAFGDWSNGATIAIYGDASGDFRAIAATDRVNGAGVVYVLIGYFNSNLYNGFNWKLYKSTVNKMINADSLDLSDAVSNHTLDQVDGDNTISPDAADPYGIYFWDILYETSEDAASNVRDRLHFFKGSALQITPAAAYPANPPASEAIQPPSDDPAPIVGDGYVLFPLGVRDGRMGGYNVDSADLTAETLRQYKAGVSLKRGAKAAHITP
jgi:hypothetical protein